MGDLAILGVVLLILLGGCLLVARAWNNRARALARSSVWTLEKHSEQGKTLVYCKKGSEFSRVGSVPDDDPDYVGKMEQLKSEGRLRLLSLNDD